MAGKFREDDEDPGASSSSSSGRKGQAPKEPSSRKERRKESPSRRSRSKQRDRSRQRRPRSRSRRRSRSRGREQGRDKDRDPSRASSSDQWRRRDRAISRSPPRQRVRPSYEAAQLKPLPAGTPALLPPLQQQLLLAAGAGVGGMGPRGPATPEDVEHFLLINSMVDPEAANRLRSLPPNLQRIVIDRGALAGTRNPSSVLICRVRDAERLKAMAMVERASGSVALDVPLHDARSTSALIMAQLSLPRGMAIPSPPVSTGAFHQL